jgi:hypothetical protein
MQGTPFIVRAGVVQRAAAVDPTWTPAETARYLSLCARLRAGGGNRVGASGSTADVHSYAALLVWRRKWRELAWPAHVEAAAVAALPAL